jgi:anti-anti-sigma factor
MTYNLKGSYEVEQGDELKEDLLNLFDSGDFSFELDFSEVEFIDISCVQVVFAFIKEARARQFSLSIVKPNDDVLQFLFMCGFIKSAAYFESFDLMDILVV